MCELKNKISCLRTVTDCMTQSMEDTLQNYEKFQGVDLTPVFSNVTDLMAVVIDYEKQIEKIAEDRRKTGAR